MRKVYSVHGPNVYKPVDDDGCPHWRQVAGQYDLMETYAPNLWRCVGYFTDQALAQKVADLLNNDFTVLLPQSLD